MLSLLIMYGTAVVDVVVALGVAVVVVSEDNYVRRLIPSQLNRLSSQHVVRLRCRSMRYAEVVEDE